MQISIFEPEGGKPPWPAVIFCIDGAGPREALTGMAARIAAHGYVVALPDLFHRGGSVLDCLPDDLPRSTASFVTKLGDPVFRQQWRARFAEPAMRPENLRADISAVFAQLDAMPNVARGPVGVTGYCLGGNIALRVAGLFGTRIGAAASFHGGFLASDQPDSPHLQASEMAAEIYVACAIEDASCTEAMQQTLDHALTRANVKHTIETYPALHGFAVPDSPAFDAAAAERHFSALSSLFSRAVRRD